MWKKKANPLQSSIRVVYSHCNFTLIDHTIHVIGDYTCMITLNVIAKNHIRLQIMKILQIFIQMICLALQFTNLSPVYKSDISRSPIIKFRPCSPQSLLCLSLISGQSIQSRNLKGHDFESHLDLGNFFEISIRYLFLLKLRKN